MPEIDRRYSFHRHAVATLEKRADAPADEPQFPNVVGYGAVFFDERDSGTEYDIFGDGTFIERIMPGAFDRAVRELDDAACLFNHDPNMIIGRVSARTLNLSIDRIGLRYECDPPENQVGKFVTQSIERKDVTGSSFGFEVTEQVWREQEDRLIREIVEVRLFDVGPVVFPAYSATTAQLSQRSRTAFDEFRASLPRHSRVALAKRRLQLLDCETR
jgi:HK97 family phage prohead protease